MPHHCAVISLSRCRSQRLQGRGNLWATGSINCEAFTKLKRLSVMLRLVTYKLLFGITVPCSKMACMRSFHDFSAWPRDWHRSRRADRASCWSCARRCPRAFFLTSREKDIHGCICIKWSYERANMDNTWNTLFPKHFNVHQTYFARDSSCCLHTQTCCFLHHQPSLPKFTSQSHYCLLCQVWGGSTEHAGQQTGSKVWNACDLFSKLQALRFQSKALTNGLC